MKMLMVSETGCVFPGGEAVFALGGEAWQCAVTGKGSVLGSWAEHEALDAGHGDRLAAGRGCSSMPARAGTSDRRCCR